jgi:hypothetical protein
MLMIVSFEINVQFVSEWYNTHMVILLVVLVDLADSILNSLYQKESEQWI